jgi:hypothetical protein
MRRLGLVLRVAPLVAAMTGCNAIFGIDDVTFVEQGGGGAGGAGGGGAGGGGTGAAGASGGTGGGGPTEICDNGVDDDDDGLVDCEDEDCPGLACLPTIPMGWEGPLVVHVGEEASSAECEAPWDVLALTGASVYQAAPAECAACGCTAVQNVTCSPITVSYYDQSDCAGSVSSSQESTQVAGCQAFSSANVLSASASLSTPSGGNCSPTGGETTSVPAVTRDRVTVCRQSQPACTDGCAPPAPAGFANVACIAKPGTDACPAGFGGPLVVYQSFVDTRGCASCSCGAPAGVACNGTVQIHTLTACSSSFDTIAYGECDLTSNDPDAFVDIPGGVTGSCPPSGGGPTGSGTALEPVTLCCPGL